MIASSQKFLMQCGIAVLRFYQSAISPFLPPSCRFTPSCSKYAERALMRHGFFKGGAMSVWRVLRCQPLGRAGIDKI